MKRGVLVDEVVVVVVVEVEVDAVVAGWSEGPYMLVVLTS